MPWFERNTDSRGRSAVPRTFARTRRRRRRRAGASSGRSCALADLPGHVLAVVADALALVGLRRALPCGCSRPPRRPPASRCRARSMRVGCGTSKSMPVGRIQLDRVRVAEREHELVALELGAVADALDLEPLLEAVGDALDHVRDQAAGEAVQRAVLAAVGRAATRISPSSCLTSMSRATRSESSPFGPLTLTSSGSIATWTPLGTGSAACRCGSCDRVPDWATSSPPTPARRASWPVMTPLEVEMIVVPMPP